MSLRSFEEKNKAKEISSTGQKIGIANEILTQRLKMHEGG